MDESPPAARKLEATATMHEGLTRSVTRGSLWTLALRVASRLVSLMSTLILARLLAPGDFGVLGIAMLSIYLIETFTQTGFEEALVQKKEQEDLESYLDTAWGVSLLRGLTIFTALIIMGPAVSWFFDSPESGVILRVLAIVPLMEGFTNIGMVFFKRQLNFSKFFVQQVTGIVINGLITIALAFYWRSVWAMVVGIMANTFSNVTLSYWLHPYRPRWRIHWGKARELFDFGKWLLGSEIVKFFVNRGDNAFVGKLLGAQALGFYGMAFKIAMMPVREVNTVISSVMFPAYAKIQDEPRRLREAYLRVLQVLGFVSIPAAGFLFVFANDFAHLVLGKKWLPIIPILQIFAFHGLISSISASTGPLFRAIGKPYIATKLISFRLIVIIATIYPMSSKWGMAGTASSVLLSSLLIDPIAIGLGAKMSGNKKRDIIKVIINPAIGTTLVCSIVRLAQMGTVGHNQSAVFIMLFIGSLLIYFAFMTLLERLTGVSSLQTIKSLVRS
jgi:O-antigen/teichoic acid export membrane protein